MAEIKNSFARSEERVLARLRAGSDKAKRERPLPKLGAEGGKVSRRRSSPIMALYKRLGVNLKNLQVEQDA
jgi:hypothetical protein